ncbi:MAG: hypothetical protein JW932_14900 [Deltaproteobacteria bacterium]|nr:hypothetical protein [Deltaproteobacteria bacterium]
MARKTKDKSRIPGVAVGEEVSTTIGEKKKACFNIGGKWFEDNARAKGGRRGGFILPREIFLAESG